MVYYVKLLWALMEFMLVYPGRLEGSYAILIGTFANDARVSKLRVEQLSNPSSGLTSNPQDFRSVAALSVYRFFNP